MTTACPSEIADSVPPPFRSLPHRKLREPADLYTALCQSGAITSCRNLAPDGHFLHQVGILPLGSEVIISQCGTPTEFVVENTAKFHLVVCFHGSIALQTAGGEITLAAKDVGLLPTGWRRSQGSHSLAWFTIDPAAVARAEKAMTGRSPRSGVDSGLFAPITLAKAQADMVRSLLATIEMCYLLGPFMASHLALDDLIHRTAVALLNPQLLTDEPSDLSLCRERVGRSNFDALIDYISANLDQRLSLSDLETRSHYSRRALQYAFRQRLHTTPKQWIREQRLILAMERLRQEGQRPSIKAVALLCGYSHLGHFSRDFKARFGLSPSDAKRG